MTSLTAADDQAFLRAIAADPDDDAPRLVYADWLEEAGDPSRAARAELIRFQATAARARPDDPRAGEAMPERIAQRWVPVWNYGLPRVDFHTWGPYRRGFIDEATVRAIGFLIHGPAILAAVPLRRLRIAYATEPQLRLLLTADVIRAVHEVWIEPTVTLPTLFPLLAEIDPWPALDRLVLRTAGDLEADDLEEQTRRWEIARGAVPRLWERFGSRLEMPPDWGSGLTC